MSPMPASTGSPRPAGEGREQQGKVMVSNLPLLFARGSPTSLESMCLEELQVFLVFVLRCEAPERGNEPGRGPRPAWWPAAAEWGEQTLSRKDHRGRTSNALRAAIRACYTYHDCLYLLEFCRKLITFTGGIENLQVVDNRDGTRSLLNRNTKKLLVTFRAENQDYDKSHFEHEGKSKTTKGLPQLGRRQQLLVGGNNRNSTNNTSDPSLTRCADVYLCDTCDRDFDQLSELVEHEVGCRLGAGQASDVSRLAGPDPTTPRLDPLLAHLKLRRVGGPAPAHRKLKESQRPRAANYEKFMSIEVSSPLGRYIVQSSGLTVDQANPAVRGYRSLQEYVREVEARCPGTVKALRNTNAYMDIRGKWATSWRGGRRRVGLWSHTYCFTQLQREAKARVMKAGLTDRAMALFRRVKQGRRLGVKLKRLDRDEVRRLEERERQADLAWEQERKERELRANLTKEEKKAARLAVQLGSRATTVAPRSRADDKVIDELLADSSDEEMLHSEKLENTSENGQTRTKVNSNGTVTSSSIETFPNTGFRTSPPAPPRPHHRPLPPLQRIVKSEPEQPRSHPAPSQIECVDLCSSDED